jgi:hypothetical protein
MLLMHHYFHSHVTDLAVMRDQANARLKPGNKYGGHGESVIHIHRSTDPCRGKEHEFYPLGNDQELHKRFWEAVEEAEEMETTR